MVILLLSTLGRGGGPGGGLEWALQPDGVNGPQYVLTLSSGSNSKGTMSRKTDDLPGTANEDVEYGEPEVVSSDCLVERMKRK